MDGQAYYAMPSPRAFSKSREPSPNKGVGITVSRSGSRPRRSSTLTSQDRPVVQLQEGHRHRSYHTSDGHLAASHMGRSLSVSDRRPSAGIRVASTGGVHVNYSKSEKRPVSHNRAASQGGYHEDGYRRRPASYYAGSAYNGSHGSGYSPTFEPSPSHSPYHGHSPVGSYSKSPTRHGTRDPSRHISYSGAGPTPMPSAPMPPSGYNNPDEELARLVQLKLELERLRDEEDRGRSGDRIKQLEKQAAVAMAMKEERERARHDAEIRASHVQMDIASMQQPARPQHIVVHPQAPAAKPKTPVPPQKKEAHPPPPKNLNDYQAKVPKNLISRAALVEKGFPYEEHKDYLLVKRYLSKDDIKSLLERTEEIRKQRAAVEKYRAVQAAKAAKEAEEAARPQIYRHTTTGGQNVHIVTVPAKPAEPVKDWREEKKEWEAQRKAEEDKRLRQEAEWRQKEEHFKAMEAAEHKKAAPVKVQQKPRRGWFS